MKDAINRWLEKSVTILISDVGKFGTGLYPIFVITCIIGVYLTMAGAKEKGIKMSSMSFLIYVLLKVMNGA